MIDSPLFAPFQILRHISHLLVRYIEPEPHDLKTDRVGCAKFHDIAVSGYFICNQNLIKILRQAKHPDLFLLHFRRSINQQSKVNTVI